MKKNLKLASVIAATLFAVTPFTGLGTATNTNTTVEARTAASDYKKLVKAKLATPMAPKKAKIKVHWYKKAKKRTLWRNINNGIAGGDITLPDGVEFDEDSGVIGNTLPEIGYITRAKRKYYMIYNDDQAPALVVGTDYQRPSLKYTKNKIKYYTLDAVDLDGEDDPDYTGIRAEEGGSLKAKQNLIIPTHHNAVTLENEETGKYEQFVPVLKPNGLISMYIHKSDFDKLVKTPANKKVRATYKKEYFYQKKGHAYYKKTKATKRFEKNEYKVANSFLKSKTEKKNAVNMIKEEIGLRFDDGITTYNVGAD